MFRRMTAFAFALAFVLGGVAARAQDKQDKESIKKRILEKVEAKLKLEEERILKEIEKVIDEELAKMEGRATPAHPSKPAAAADKPAVPANAKKAETKPGFLGVMLEELDENARAERDLPADAALAIQQVVAKSPAETAGLKAGDVILSIGKSKVDSVESATKEIMKLGAGAKVSLTVLRGGEKINVDAKLAERPDQDMDEETPDENEGDESHEGKKEGEPKSSEGLRDRIKKFMDGDKDGASSSKPAQPADDLSKRLDDLLSKPDIQKGLTAALEQLKKMGLKADEYVVAKDGKIELTETAREELRKRLESLNPERLERRLDQISRWVEDFSSSEPGAIQDRIRKFIENKPEAGSKAATAAPRPLLGVRVQPIGDDVRAQFDLEQGVGMSIAEVAKGTAAEKAGLKSGDLILALDGKTLKGEAELSKSLRRHAAGDEVEIKILREGKEQTLKVKLGTE